MNIKTNSNEVSRAEELSELISSYLLLLDVTATNLSNSDFDLLDDTITELKNKISREQSLMPISIALGKGIYDSTEDKLKIRTMEALINLLRVRKEGYERLK